MAHAVSFHEAVAIKINIDQLRAFLKKFVPLSNLVLEIDHMLVQLLSHLLYCLQLLSDLLIVALEARQILFFLVKYTLEGHQLLLDLLL